MSFWTYILRLSNGIYYTGHTDNLDVRVAQHKSGAVKGYTSKHLPVELMWSAEFPTRKEAFAAEWRIRGWSRKKKEALIAGRWDLVSKAAIPPSERRERAAATASASLGRMSRLRSTRAVESAPLTSKTAHLERSRETRSSEAETNADGDDPLTSKTAHLERSRETRSSEAETNADGNDPVTSKTAHLERSRETQSSEAETPSHANEPAIILVRPQLGENIGKAARAMLNFGLTDLRLVSPRDGWPNPGAGPAASGADIVLERARVYDSVAEAVADCPHVYATTVRKRGLVVPVATPEEAARSMRGAHGKSAILFGAERSGLETEDVAVAGTIITVPINPEFGSLNLAQAVILVAYEWSKHEALAQPTIGDEAEPRAPQGHLDGLIGQMNEALERAGYFFPPDRTPATLATIRTIMTKAGWSVREIQALRGMIRTIEQPRRRGKPAKD